jgi:hypothetical protein
MKLRTKHLNLDLFSPYRPFAKCVEKMIAEMEDAGTEEVHKVVQPRK